MKKNKNNIISELNKELVLARTIWAGGLLGVIGAIVSIFAPVVGIPVVAVGCIIVVGTVISSFAIDKQKNKQSKNNSIIEVTDYEDITNKEQKITQKEFQSSILKNNEKTNQKDERAL